MKINRHDLPCLLLELIAQGRWKVPSESEAIWSLTGFEKSARLRFLDVSGMEGITSQAIALADSDPADGYGLARDEKADGKPGYLNVDKAVAIAIDYDEGLICLDYSCNEEEPRVVCSSWPEGAASCTWHTIAGSFGEFVSAIRLASNREG